MVIKDPRFPFAVDIMNGRNGRRFSEDEILTIFTQMATAVELMHRADPPIAHRDLKVSPVALLPVASCLALSVRLSCSVSCLLPHP